VCPVMRFPACKAAACFCAEARSREKGLDSPRAAAWHWETRSQSSEVETETPPSSMSGPLPGSLCDTCRNIRSGVDVLPVWCWWRFKWGREVETYP